MKFFKYALNFSEIKNFINKVRLENIHRTVGVSIYDIPTDKIFISKNTKNPIFDLYHEGGHKLSKFKKTFLLGKERVLNDLLDERIANSTALKHLTNPKDIAAYKNYAEKNYKTYKHTGMMTMDDLFGSADNVLNQIELKKPGASEIFYSLPTIDLKDRYVKHLLGKEYKIQKRKNGIRILDEIRKKAWEI